MLAAHPLNKTGKPSILYEIIAGPYSRPTVNKAETPAFLLIGSWRLQIEYNGRARMAKSDTMFHEAVKRELAFGSRQWPGTIGFQIFSRGLQANMSQKKTKRYTKRLLQIKKWIALKMKPALEVTNIRKYWSSSASFAKYMTGQYRISK